MRRTIMTLMLSLLALAIVPCLTQAQPICFQAAPFVDVFTLTTAVVSVTPLRVSITSATMTAPDLYELGGAGVVFISALDPIGQYALRAPMTNPGAFFGGNADCALNATISPSTLTGSWRLTCAGTTNPFTVPGTLALIDCPGEVGIATVPMTELEALDAIRAQGLTAAGEAFNNTFSE